MAFQTVSYILIIYLMLQGHFSYKSEGKNAEKASDGARGICWDLFGNLFLHMHAYNMAHEIL